MPDPVNKQTYAIKKWTQGSGRDLQYKSGLFRSLKFIILKRFIVEIKMKEDHDWIWKAFKGHSMDFLNAIISENGIGYFR